MAVTLISHVSLRTSQVFLAAFIVPIVPVSVGIIGVMSLLAHNAKLSNP
jgi:hypothetical protein